MKKRILSIVLVFAISIMQISIVSADQVVKDYQGHWAEETIELWMEKDLVNGFPDGSFKPNENVTRAQFVTMLDKVFGYRFAGNNVYSDMKATDWYYNTILKVSAAGIVGGSDGMFRPNDFITRQEAAVALYNAYIMSKSGNDATKRFDDANTIAPWAKAQINTLVENKYMNGRTEKTIAPSGYLTRAEAVTLLANISGSVITKEGTIKGKLDANFLINTPDVVLEDAVVDGNLYISPGVAEGDVTLNNVTIKGELVILGGGENSIVLKDSSVNGIIVQKIPGRVRIVAQGSTKIKNTVLKSGAILKEEKLTGEGFRAVQIKTIELGELVTLNGDFTEINVEAAETSIEITGGSIDLFNIDEKAVGTEVNISSIATIKKVTVKAATDFKGKGKIEEAYVESNGVYFEKEPKKLEIAKDIEVEIAEKKRLLITLPSVGPVTIEAPSNASAEDIYKKILDAVIRNKDSLLNNHSEVINKLDVKLYGEGTIFEEALEIGNNKDKISAALDVMKHQSMNNIKTELEKMVEQEGLKDFKKVTYGDNYLEEIKVGEDAITEPEKAIEKIFNLFNKINMQTNETYVIIVTLSDSTTKTVSITVSPNN